MARFVQYTVIFTADDAVVMLGDRRMHGPRAASLFGLGSPVPCYSSCSCSCWNRFSNGSKNPDGFLNTQYSATKLCIHIRARIPYISTVLDFYISKLISN